MKDLCEMVERIVRSYWSHYLSRVKLQGAIYYAEAVLGVRALFLLFCLAAVCIVVFASGLLLIPVALCFYMPWPSDVKAVVAMLFGVGYALGALVVLAAICSEKRWLKVSGAKALMTRAVKGT
ncbi:MAG TPA: hypothetical protein VML36_06835 [Nitrospiria bacterium]|nr:hypothetical protein [Nitrospiria bacterium]